MRVVGIRQLKDREYVRLAAAGETLLVTDRGRVAAARRSWLDRPFRWMLSLPTGSGAV